MMNFDTAKEKLSALGQDQLLHYYDGLSGEQQESLLEQIERMDFSYLDELKHRQEDAPRGVISPISAMAIDEINEKKDHFTAVGQKAMQEGKLGLVLLAGGSGTRLGYSGPKGTYNIGETKDVFIFQRLIENLMEEARKANVWLHLFIMTSETNDAATRAFFSDHGNFGYHPDYLHFFRQDMAPVVDADGKMFLEEQDRIAASPNGNGGWFRSMLNAGYGELMEQEGITWLNVFAVDNVLQRIADPAFFGAVLEGGYDCGSKVVRKADRNEKVGVMCLEDGRPSIIEYIEMTDAMLDETTADGDPAYNFGVILNYLFSVEQLKHIVDFAMPVHFAFKRVDYVDESGKRAVPEAPNAWKFEYFILDMVHELGSCLPYEVEREKEFAPIKNLHGKDSVDSARELCRQNGIEL